MLWRRLLHPCIIAPMVTAPRGSRRASALLLARGLLLTLAWILPFEAPLFRVGPLHITTVELVLYALLLAWGLAVIARATRAPRPLEELLAALPRDPLARAALAWSAVMFVSAALAPQDRAAAVKFALRTTSGVLAFFAVRTLVDARPFGQRVLLALVAGGLVSAGTALLDAFVPGSKVAWAIFREGHFDFFGLERASGVFAYPTIGAMYWEAALPLAVVAPFASGLGLWETWRARRSGPTMRGSIFVVVIAGALLVGSLLASATRAGVAGAAAGCMAITWLVRQSAAPVRQASAWVLAMLVASWAVTLGASRFGSLLGERLQWWHDADWFGVEYEAETTPRAVRTQQEFTSRVRLRNRGTVTWHRAGEHPTRLAYHWEPIGRRATESDFEGQRTELSTDVPPGGAADVAAHVRGPISEGSYRLRWDLVQEGITWFGDRGNPMPAQPFDVTATEGVAIALAGEAAPPVFAVPPAPRRALWRAAIVLWRQHPLLGVGPDNFRRRYEAILSPSPTGDAYTDTRVHANNLYLETLADTGVVGVAALGFLVAAWAAALRRAHATGSLAGMACGVAAGTFFVHGGLDYFFEFTPLFGLFWVLLGLLAAFAAEPVSP
jgi:O-Antigen ligase